MICTFRYLHADHSSLHHTNVYCDIILYEHGELVDSSSRGPSRNNQSLALCFQVATLSGWLLVKIAVSSIIQFLGEQSIWDSSLIVLSTRGRPLPCRLCGSHPSSSTWARAKHYVVERVHCTFNLVWGQVACHMHFSLHSMSSANRDISQFPIYRFYHT